MNRRYLFGISLTLLFLAACTYNRPNQVKTQIELDERGRELTSGAKISVDAAKQHIGNAKTLLDTAVVPTNNTVAPVTLTQPAFRSTTNEVGKAAQALGVSADLLRRDENVIGKPLADQTPVILALLSENKLVRQYAELKEQTREAEETRWRAKVEELERRLVDYGTRYEQARNDKITTWIKWSVFGLLIIGLPIAMLILFPPLASLLVGLVPALGAVFNTPVSLTRGLVRNIGNARGELQQQIQHDNEAANRLPGYQTRTYTADAVLQLLDSHLNKVAKTNGDKRVIDHFRETQNV